MKKHIKIITIYGGIAIIFVIAIVGIVVSSLKEYHDKNSWAVFEIAGDGIKDGETKFSCTPNTNVREYQDIKYYGKGETILLDYASFTINRVDIGEKKGVTISSDNDLLYNGEITHKVYLTVGDGCRLQAQGKSVTISLKDIGYQ